MDEQLEFVKLIASRLDTAGIPYMLTGSMAMTIYSIPRMTRDIDMVIEVNPVDIEKLVRLFSDDCYIDQGAVKEAVHTKGMFNIIHNNWVIKADFIIKKNGDYRREEFERRKKINIGDMAISVVTTEDLILSKLVWAKQSQSDLQLSDVRKIIVSVTGLDWTYMQKWAAMLGIEDILKKVMKNE